MHILLTNDDSYDSPLFHILYDSLLKLGLKVSCVVPATEQSWTGKSMSRQKKLITKETNIEGRPFTSLSGTPADCVNFGLYNKCQSKPDLVISGINMGYNVGLSYIFSSGTIGAAIEGYLNGIPSIAFSQRLKSEDYIHWNEKRSFDSKTREILRLQTEEILEKLMPYLRNHVQTQDLWTIEIPDRLCENWQIRETKPSLLHYGQTFEKNDDGSFSHVSPTPVMEDTEGTDIHAMMNGHVALNRIDFKGLCKL